MKKVIVILTWATMLLTACSNSDSTPWDAEIDWDVEESGYTYCFPLRDNIPVTIMDIADMPDWIQESLGAWDGSQSVIYNTQLFQGKWKGETVYFWYNKLITDLGRCFYHHDGRQIGLEEYSSLDDPYHYGEFSDWRCIFSAAPLKKGLVGTFHYDSSGGGNNYLESSHYRFYTWGYLNTNDLQKYDGKYVTLSGFLYSDITDIINDCPAGITCYGIEATLIKVCLQ